MPIHALSYSAGRVQNTPTLFSSTRDLDFFSDDGRLDHRILRQGPRGLRVVHVRSTGHSATFVEENRTAVTLPIKGYAKVSIGQRNLRTRPGLLFAIGPSERSSMLHPERPGDHYESYTVVTPPKWLHALEDEALLCGLDPVGLKFRELLEFSFDYLSDPELVSDRTVLLHEALVEDALIETLKSPSALHNSDHTSYRYESLAKAVQDYVGDNYAEPITVTEIAAALNVPLRTLQTAFKSRRGMTVRTHIAKVRIAAMRERLLKPDPTTTVTSAAVDAGLFHLGRSSAAYQAKFGELPSETLDRALAYDKDD